jgi:hypothetical protein
MLSMKNKYWHIEGYDGLNKIYERKVQVSSFTEGQIQNVLMALAAKAGLSFDEIVGAYAKRNTKISNQLLSVQKDGPHLKFSCGENPHFTARIVD